MRLHEVVSKKDKRDFLELPKRLYKNDANWICPFDTDIDGIFNPEINSNYEHGEAIRWLLLDENEVQVGRIAAFIDNNKSDHYKYPTGGCGFFECINSQEAANMLFDAAKNWLAERKIEAMQGPINFGENFLHWGLLVDGFMQQAYGMPYNFPYYQKLFETYGFKNYFEQYSYHKPLDEGWPERLLKFAELTTKRPGYSFEFFSYDRIDEFVDYFVEIYNKIWSAYHDNYSPMKESDIKNLLLDFKPIVDPDLISFAFDKGKPVGLMLSIPDVNQLLKKLKNGRLTFINKLKFLYYKKRVITRNRALLAGIHPDYQNTGIVLALFYQLVDALKDKPRQKEVELSWVADYNPKMIGIYDKIGAKRVKTHVTYLYQFDQSLPFERFTNDFEGKKY